MTETGGPFFFDLAGLELQDDEAEWLSHPWVGGVILFGRNCRGPEQVAAAFRALGRRPWVLGPASDGGYWLIGASATRRLPRDALDGEKTVYEEITGGVDVLQIGRREINGRAYVASFNFKGSDQQKKVGTLSGGERNRVHLAKMLKEGANVLLLDEPTNDLDVNTLRALEEALLNFAGCAVVISHDRWFLDRVATHILAFEGDSEVRWFPGNYSEYEEDRRERLGAAADIPKRIKYRQLTR